MDITKDLEAHRAAVEGMVTRSTDVLERIAASLHSCFRAGGKVLICGNGGSAADAQHFAAEFMNRMHFDRDPWPMVALTTDTSVMTAIANDASYDSLFSRQVAALGRPGDVLIGLSTSGRSTSVLRALETARRLRLVTIGFTGTAGIEPMRPLCDVLLAVPSTETPRIQEAHEFAYHVISKIVEAEMVAGHAAPDSRA